MLVLLFWLALLLLLLIIFKSLVLSNLLNDACVSKIMLGFLTIVPQFTVDTVFLLLHCSTDVNGFDTDVTKIGAVAFFVSFFVTLNALILLLLLLLVLFWLLLLLFFTLAKTNWFEWFCAPPLARPLS